MIMADKTKEQSVEELKTCYYDYELPPGFIAQEPLPERDKARMMVVKRKTGDILHSTVKELPSFLAPGDLLVLNDTRVLPARLQGLKKNTGAKIEVFLLRPLSDDIWET
ncbi:MAG: S-adenosylmethionine:tRNA ribosyltransferase-isomerase, partial [Firmicutes bacterium]|nr:S-adenosylmethionine:tRNA ribosyltransferase-isomerase [Bacillota bacterium]